MLVYQEKIVQWLISSVCVLIPSSCGERPWKTRSWLTQHLECPTVCLKWNVHVATIPDPTHKCSKPSRVYPQTSRAWKSAPIQKNTLAPAAIVEKGVQGAEPQQHRQFQRPAHFAKGPVEGGVQIDHRLVWFGGPILGGGHDLGGVSRNLWGLWHYDYHPLM